MAETDGVLEAARRLGHARTSVTTRHYARPMMGGDRVVADRLDRARQDAREKSSGTDVARMWHEASSSTGSAAGLEPPYADDLQR